MNKALLLFILCLICSCDDGDLLIETIDFNDTSINFCESTTTTSSTLFFKLNTTDALVLQLQSGLLANEVSTDTIRSAVPGQSQVIYRTFSEDVDKDYFCDVVPPLTPIVVDEYEGQGGEVFITTVQSESDTTVFEHKIELSEISLVNSEGLRITDLRINEFGTITTKE
ncbi:hypothetical protein [uncultured Eudoraea sp.]|uniref:hypothetical protein n=1 Tax=uncultured Eudoraea sp. TaxID=1035614 RepID=UPI002605224F|nr:hypothetical protein [uncultured Eudoraea sp.]